MTGGATEKDYRIPDTCKQSYRLQGSLIDRDDENADVTSDGNRQNARIASSVNTTLGENGTNHYSGISKKPLSAHNKWVKILWGPREMVPLETVNIEEGFDQFCHILLSVAQKDLSLANIFNKIQQCTREATHTCESEGCDAFNFTQINSTMEGVCPEVAFHQELELLNLNGNIVYFGNRPTKELDKIVIFNPKWIADEITPILGISKTKSNVIEDLRKLCENCGIFCPGQIHYPLPSTEFEESSSSPWTLFDDCNHYQTILCHAWLVREDLPKKCIDDLSTAITKNLTIEFLDDQAVSVEKLEWDDTHIYVKVVAKILKGGREKRITNEVCVRLTHANPQKCNLRKFMVYGKGYEAKGGENIWKLGFASVLNTVDDFVRRCTNEKIERRVACPECVLSKDLRKIPSWNIDTIKKLPDRGVVRCGLDSNSHAYHKELLCGTFTNSNAYLCGWEDMVTSLQWKEMTASFTGLMPYANKVVSKGGALSPRAFIKDPTTIVLVGGRCLESGEVYTLGSGFIADKTKGLIVTAGHLFYDIAKDQSFTPLESGNTDTIIGVYDIKTKKSSFKYTADIAVNGLATGDCCILRLTGKFVNNVDSNGYVVSSSEEIRSLDAAELEGLSDLPLADSYDMNTSTRTWGYGQEDDAFSSPFESINRSLSNVSGFVTKILERPCTESTTLGSTDIHRTENQVVVNLIDAIARDGLSGGPVVNGECQVVGIQSICDPADEKRTFVVPSTIIKELLTKNENEVL